MDGLTRLQVSGSKAGTDGPEDVGPYLVRVIWVLAGLSGLFLGLRLYSKLWRGRPLWWDDHFLVAAWVSSTAFCAGLYCCGFSDKFVLDIPRRLGSAPDSGRQPRPRQALRRHDRDTEVLCVPLLHLGRLRVHPSDGLEQDRVCDIAAAHLDRAGQDGGLDHHRLDQRRLWRQRPDTVDTVLARGEGLGLVLGGIVLAECYSAGYKHIRGW